MILIPSFFFGFKNVNVSKFPEYTKKNFLCEVRVVFYLKGILYLYFHILVSREHVLKVLLHIL